MAAEELTGSFLAEGGDGRQHLVNVYADVVDVGTRADPAATGPGEKRFRTSGGQTVTRLEKGLYQVVETGVLLRSNSPDAP